VLCQFRRNKICLYHYREDGQWMRSTTIWRDVFKDLVAANKRYRIKVRAAAQASGQQSLWGSHGELGEGGWSQELPSARASQSLLQAA
jgi:hypothetical protein